MFISKLINLLENYKKLSFEGKKIILVAILIAFAITLKSTITLMGFIPMDLNAEYPIRIQNWFFSILIISSYSWLVIDFNLRRKSKLFPKISKLGSFIVLLLGNFLIFSASLVMQVIAVYILESVVIAGEKLFILTFGWFIIFAISMLIVEIFKLQQKTKHDAIDKEILKREKIQSELNEIKNQMNPHFLFNSLNSLHSLIRSNPEKASLFVSNLSMLYRYVLQSKEKDLVSIAEELSFLKNYTDLIRIRYRDKFQINIDIDNSKFYLSIPVLSIQLLVENAIKHNEISEENPLKVMVNIVDKHLVVTHKLRPRKTLIQSTGNGIVNLSRRCQYLIGKDIEILKDENFTVRIPIKNK